MSSIRRFYAELRRRKVIRVAIVYAAIAWLLLQFAEVTFEPLRLPEWALTLVIVLAIFGFPIVVALAWVFDITPAGVRRTEPSAVSDADSDPGATRGESPPTVADRARGPQNSIAVLPFANIGGEQENDYFCDGLAEDLLIVLSRLKGLRVAARSSAFAFKGRLTDIRTIGEQLNVGSVLEGSVRKSGDRLRITVRLIDTENGYQRWSATYDRELDDIFKVQDEISRSVYEAFHCDLFPDSEAPEVRPGTGSVEAYDLYLLGRHHFHKRTEASLQNAVGYFQRAIELDLAFALPYTGLADAYGLLASSGTGYGNMPMDEAIAKAKPLVRAALELDESLAEAHASLGFLRRLEKDLDGSERAFRRAMELNPGYPMAHVWLGLTLADQGRVREALAEHERAYELDPLSTIVITNVGYDYLKFGRYDEAREKLLRVIELDPGFPVPYSGMARLERMLGNWPKALEWAGEAARVSPTRSYYQSLLCALHLQLEDYASASAALERAERLNPEDPAVERARIALLIVAEDYDALVAYAEAALDEPTGDPETACNLAVAYLLAGDPGRARAQYENACGYLLESVNDAVVWSWRYPHGLLYADALIRDGEFDKARPLLDEYLERLESLRSQGLVNPALDYLIAGTRCLLGEREAAAAALERALEGGFRHRWWAAHDPTVSALRENGLLAGWLSNAPADGGT